MLFGYCSCLQCSSLSVARQLAGLSELCWEKQQFKFSACYVLNEWIIRTRLREALMTLHPGRTLRAYRAPDMPAVMYCQLEIRKWHQSALISQQQSILSVSDGVDKELCSPPQVSRDSTRAAGGKRHPVQVWSVWEHRGVIFLSLLISAPPPDHTALLWSDMVAQWLILSPHCKEVAGLIPGLAPFNVPFEVSAWVLFMLSSFLPQSSFVEIGM